MLIDKYSNSVYNLAYNFCGNKDDASDITQDIFIKIYNNIDKFNENYNLSSWIMRISKNHCIDYWRKNKKNSSRITFEEDLAVENESPEDELIKKSEIENLRKILLRLKPESRALIIFRDINNHSYQEISEFLDIPIGTVKSRINRARIQLAGLYKNGH